MKIQTSPLTQDPVFRKRALFLVAAFILIVIGSIFQYDYSPAKWMTYRNFDVPGQKNFINYLQPGVKDSSSNLKYDFKHQNYILLGIVFLVFFPAMLLLRIAADPDFKLGVYRYLTQWLTFVIARLGILRVTGICPVKRTGLGVFPFINCQSCELATGACPLGTFQMSLLNKQIPFILIGELILVGILSGRTVCGWFCPYGFLSDIFDKIPGKKLTMPLKLTWIKYAVLVFFIGTSLSYFFKSRSDILLYCSYLCPAGFFYGVLEYALTTGIHAVNKGLPFIHIMLAYHFLLGFIVLIGSIKLGGRFFCKFLCPLGTILGLFSRISLFSLEINQQKCTACKKCSEVCPMHISVLNRSFTSRSSCIMCGRCQKVCPTGKIQFAFNLIHNKSQESTIADNNPREILLHEKKRKNRKAGAV